MKHKHILLVLRQFREELFESITERAKELDWCIEFHRDTVPSNWYGDGIIIDYLRPRDMELLRPGIPIATRSAMVQEGIFSVHGNVESITRMVFDFFRSRNYRHYCVLNEFRGIPALDPVACMQKLVEEAGLKYYSLCWAEEMQDQETVDFAEAVKTIKTFLLNVPKPCAAFTGSIQRIHYIYRACEEANIRIPEELAIIANTDDPGFGVNLSPPVSVLVGELPRVGKELVEGLNSLMHGNPAPKEVTLVQPTNIIVRKSSDTYAVEHPPTMQAINYILEHYENPQLGLRDIIHASGCSARTLQRNFLEHLTMLPSQFLQNIRLEAAAKLLRQTELTLHEIAERVGYGSNMSLSLAFKRKYGFPPGKYRSQARIPNSTVTGTNVRK